MTIADHWAAETEVDKLYLCPQLRQRLSHLDLAGRLHVDGNFAPGGTYGDIATGRCISASRGEIKVAIKRLRVFRKEVDWQLLEKEIYVWAKLAHENVLGLIGYNIDEATGIPTLVSEWMDNGTAWQYVRSHPDADMLRLVTGIARGLAYLHENGVVHSDIKSDNILISDSGEARICDFGCSRMISASLSIANLSSTFKGTMRYLACELMREGTAYSTETDVWAFGMTVFELLTLQRPYGDLTEVQAVSAIQRLELPNFPPSFQWSLHQEAANVLRHVCQSSWRSQAANRPTMANVVKALEWQLERRSKAAEYSLRIGCLSDVWWSPELQYAYVEVKVGDTVLRTGTVERAMPLVWNESIVFVAPDTSAILSICVKQCSQDAIIDHAVGEVTIKLEELLSACACGETQLYLSVPANGTPSVSCGVIHVYIKDTDAEQHVHIDIEKARQQILATSQSPYAVQPLIYQLDSIIEATNVIAVRIQPYINLVLHVASALYRVISHLEHVGQLVVDMVRTMEQAIEFASNARILANRCLNLREIVDDILKRAVKCCHSLQRHVDQRVNQDADSIKDIEEQTGRFLELKKLLDAGIALSSALRDSNNDWRHRLELLEKFLQPSQTDISRRLRCLPGTRSSYLDRIANWLFSETDRNILCLSGVAGSGKSTIAATIADHCDEEHCLAAHLFFERGRSAYNSIIRTIAYKLAVFDSTIASHVVKAIDSQRNILDAPLAKQFERLVFEPLKAAAPTIRSPTVIILDALDECGTIAERRELMRLLKFEFPKLPSKVRFLVTSRPEDDVVKTISQQGHVHVIGLDHTSMESKRDIRAYLEYSMREAITEPISDDFDWDGNMGLLAEAAKGLFVWVSTAVSMVSDSDDPLEKLEELVSNSQSLNEYGLDSLYATVLVRSGISWHEAKSRYRSTRVLGLILFAKEALSDAVMDVMLGLEAGKSRLTLQRLRSVVFYEPGRPVHFHHASFADYITSLERSGNREWFIETKDQKQAIVSRCFEIMKEALKFNICNLESSFVQNDSVPDFKQRVGEYILPHLMYVCRFWAEHLCDIACSPDEAHPYEMLKRFAYSHLLYWFEVLSLTGNFNHTAGRALYSAFMWTSANDGPLPAFLWEAYMLANSFALPISQSVPHVYLSLLSLRRTESVVSEHYSTIHPTIRVHLLGNKPRDPCIRILRGHTDVIHSLAVSADGRYIVSGSQDNTIRIWNAESGELVLDALNAHRGAVKSIALSPSSKLVVAGYADKSVCIWSIENGTIVAGPYLGHKREVRTVAYSPDGQFVVSGGLDKSIRIWAVESGELVFGPLQEHSGNVLELTYSPNGDRIVSCSDDRSIRSWDAKSGRLMSIPFQGHTKDVNSVAVSPDGRHVVTGSNDCSVRIWNAESGKTTTGPLREHAGRVTSVAFSPNDGKLVASSSWDRTIRIWDSMSGELVSGPFQDSGVLTSVAFFPDGRRIASASSDGLIRVWDVQFGKTSSSRFDGHMPGITSVAFSSDGVHAASGHRDGTIRVWNVKTGKVTSGRFEGHSQTITSVTFSPSGNLLASASWDQSIRLWDTESGGAVLSPLKGHTFWVMSVAFSFDGKRVASGSSDKTIRIWDIESGETTLGPLSGHEGVVFSVTFSPDGKRIASGSEDRSIRLWDCESGELVFGPLFGHMSVVTSVAFSPDGRCLVSSSWDKTLLLWEAETGRAFTLPLEEHNGGVSSVSFSPNGESIASGSRDYSIILWSAKTTQVTRRFFTGHTDVINSVSFSPDGKHIISGSTDGTIRVWSMENDVTEANQIVTHASGVASRSCHKRASFNGPNNSSQVLDVDKGAARSTVPKNCVPSNWRVAEDGWIRGDRGELLIWIPEDIRTTLWHPCNTAILNCEFVTVLDFSGCPIGENWSNGYPLQREETEHISIAEGKS